MSVFAQSKGGVGKSFICYFKTLTCDLNDVAVVLLDSSDKSTENSKKYSALLGESNVNVANIYSAKNVYTKSNFYNIFEGIAGLPQGSVIVDMGAPESNVLREGLMEARQELSGEELSLITKELDLEVIFNVVVSGAQDQIDRNLEYFASLKKGLGDYFRLNLVINDVFFDDDGESDELKQTLIADGLAAEENIFIAGQTGKRYDDQTYYKLMSVLNGEESLEAVNQSVVSRIRMRKILEPLKTL